MWNRNEISEHGSHRLLLWVTQLLRAAWQTSWLFYCVQIYGQIQIGWETAKEKKDTKQQQ